MWEPVLAEDLLWAKKKEDAKAFAGKRVQVLTSFPVQCSPGGDFPHVVSQSSHAFFSFSALKLVSNEFRLLSK